MALRRHLVSRFVPQLLLRGLRIQRNCQLRIAPIRPLFVPFVGETIPRRRQKKLAKPSPVIRSPFSECKRAAGLSAANTTAYGVEVRIDERDFKQYTRPS